DLERAGRELSRFEGHSPVPSRSLEPPEPAWEASLRSEERRVGKEGRPRFNPHRSNIPTESGRLTARPPGSLPPSIRPDDDVVDFAPAWGPAGRVGAVGLCGLAIRPRARRSRAVPIRGPFTGSIPFARAARTRLGSQPQIGRASCRERGQTSVQPASLKHTYGIGTADSPAPWVPAAVDPA